MPDTVFRLMSAVMAVEDLLLPHHIDKRVATFGLREGMTVVDYGCGPGRYTTKFSKLVGESGRVYAADVQELALEAVKRRTEEQDLDNVIPVLAKGYETRIPDHVADVVCAIDVFLMVGEPSVFLREAHRITKPEGTLIIDDGHQSRQRTLRKIRASGCWRIAEGSRDRLECMPLR